MSAKLRFTMKCSSSFRNLFSSSSFISMRSCSTTAASKVRFKRGLICQPALTDVEIGSVKTILGLHVGPNYVSWVTLETEKNEISSMGITSFPENFEKMKLDGLSLFASQSVRMLPKANYYIVEEAVKAVSGTAGRHQLMFQSSRLQYIAMLVALINFQSNAAEGHENRVLFLKHKLAARLFGLLVGTEVVSSAKIVNDILNKNMPPRFSTVQCSDKLRSEFSARSKIEKEVIGLSLITAVTFLELMLRRNENCLGFVGISSTPSKGKKSKDAASSVNE